MLINKEEAMLRIREQIARETPEYGADIEERLRIYHRRKAKEEVLKAIEEITAPEPKSFREAIFEAAEEPVQALPAIEEFNPAIYSPEPIPAEKALQALDITELVKKYIEKAEKAIREEEETK